MRIVYIFILFGLTLRVALCQEATKNNDLRKEYTLFKIKDVQNNQKSREFRLSSSVSGAYNLTILEDENVSKKKKIDSKYAQSIDEKFVDHFITLKYLMKSQEVKKCIEAYNLNLRGEQLVICSTESKKLAKLEGYLSELKKIINKKG